MTPCSLITLFFFLLSFFLTLGDDIGFDGHEKDMNGDPGFRLSRD